MSVKTHGAMYKLTVSFQFCLNHSFKIILLQFRLKNWGWWKWTMIVMYFFTEWLTVYREWHNGAGYYTHQLCQEAWKVVSCENCQPIQNTIGKWHIAFHTWPSKIKYESGKCFCKNSSTLKFICRLGFL